MGRNAKRTGSRRLIFEYRQLVQRLQRNGFELVGISNRMRPGHLQIIRIVSFLPVCKFRNARPIQITGTIGITMYAVLWNVTMVMAIAIWLVCRNRYAFILWNRKFDYGGAANGIAGDSGEAAGYGYWEDNVHNLIRLHEVAYQAMHDADHQEIQNWLAAAHFV
ncbi:MAG: hypothetical protein IPG90_04220 [Bacteroidetes bacterium]|nr:hypothetical protein [Bacteroidota bacterium]